MCVLLVFEEAENVSNVNKQTQALKVIQPVTGNCLMTCTILFYYSMWVKLRLILNMSQYDISNHFH